MMTSTEEGISVDLFRLRECCLETPPLLLFIIPSDFGQKMNSQVTI